MGIEKSQDEQKKETKELTPEEELLDRKAAGIISRIQGIFTGLGIDQLTLAAEKEKKEETHTQDDEEDGPTINLSGEGEEDTEEPVETIAENTEENNKEEDSEDIPPYTTKYKRDDDTRTEMSALSLNFDKLPATTPIAPIKAEFQGQKVELNRIRTDIQLTVGAETRGEKTTTLQIMHTNKRGEHVIVWYDFTSQNGVYTGIAMEATPLLAKDVIGTRDDTILNVSLDTDVMKSLGKGAMENIIVPLEERLQEAENIVQVKSSLPASQPEVIGDERTVKAQLEEESTLQVVDLSALREERERENATGPETPMQTTAATALRTTDDILELADARESYIEPEEENTEGNESPAEEHLKYETEDLRQEGEAITLYWNEIGAEKGKDLVDRLTGKRTETTITKKTIEQNDQEKTILTLTNTNEAGQHVSAIYEFTTVDGKCTSLRLKLTPIFKGEDRTPPSTYDAILNFDLMHMPLNSTQENGYKRSMTILQSYLDVAKGVIVQDGKTYFQYLHDITLEEKNGADDELDKRLSDLG